MIDTRYLIKFDDIVCAVDMDLQTAIILAEALATKYYESMSCGSKIVLEVYTSTTE